MRYLQGGAVFLLFPWIWADPLTIITDQGTILGKKTISRNGTEYRSFLGIPYAKPPVGKLRFQPPQEPENWNGIRDATKFPPRCMQKEIFNSTAGLASVHGDEDCLYLNVATPLLASSVSKLPVLVYIHGGGFITDSANDYSPEYFMDYNVILVIPNYRLGPFGFLSTADSVIPGNYGMKDQVAALKWVKKNIAVFGGDSERVTIFGESAGGASVNFHLYSPLSKGLFQRAISHSGSALSVWARSRPRVIRQKTLALGLLVGCPEYSSAVLLECLQSIPAEKLMLAHHKFYVWDFEPTIPFSIVPEPLSVEDAFIHEDPWNSEPVNKVPWITGITSGEGAIRVSKYLSDNGYLIKELNMDYIRLIPLMINFIYWFDYPKTNRLTEDIKQFYFKDEEIGIKTANNCVNMLTDGIFYYPTYEGMRRFSKKFWMSLISEPSVYFYYYDHRNAKSFSDLSGNSGLNLGVCHCDDLISFFPFPQLGDVKSTNGTDFVVSVRLIERWIKFAQTGNPSTDDSLWDPFDENKINYLHITSAGDDMKEGLLLDRIEFYKNSVLRKTIDSEELDKDDVDIWKPTEPKDEL